MLSHFVCYDVRVARVHQVILTFDAPAVVFCNLFLGFFGEREEKICQEAKYLTCASTYPGQVQTYDKRFSLYRLRPAYKVGPALIKWLELPGPKK